VLCDGGREATVGVGCIASSATAPWGMPTQRFSDADAYCIEGVSRVRVRGL